jgi:CubicO group peptidase (beta-lactamase class C family)
LIVTVQIAAAEHPKGLTRAAPESAGMIGAQLNYISEAVAAAIAAREIPGAVVLVVRRNHICYLEAFGNRSLLPHKEAMTPDTVFDVASLTKVLATAPSIMVLVEQGKVRLEQRAARYLPRFTGGGKDEITVRQLLTHYSGLRADFDLSKPWNGYEAAMQELWKEATQTKPGKEFLYSDLNFIALAEIVRSVSGKDLSAFARQHIFEKLGMSETAFRPPASWRARIAPTEPRNRTLAYLRGQPEGLDQMVRGEVHDPTAWRMGGVTGHAGLFSTAGDIAVFAQMMLNGGSYNGKRVLSPLGVRAMTTPQSPADSPYVRGLGWDIASQYSAPRGDLLGSGYGHTGFTGTSLWIDPATQTAIMILSNRVHPDGKGDVTHLRAIIANVVAASIADAP